MLGAGVALASRRVLRVGGEDALKLLQGIVSNDVRRLAEPGAAPVYAAIQNAQGRVEHDVFLHREMGDGPSGGALLADLPAEGFDAAVVISCARCASARASPSTTPATTSPSSPPPRTTTTTTRRRRRRTSTPSARSRSFPRSACTP